MIQYVASCEIMSLNIVLLINKYIEKVFPCTCQHYCTNDITSQWSLISQISLHHYHHNYSICLLAMDWRKTLGNFAPPYNSRGIEVQVRQIIGNWAKGEGFSSPVECSSSCRLEWGVTAPPSQHISLYSSEQQLLLLSPYFSINNSHFQSGPSYILYYRFRMSYLYYVFDQVHCTGILYECRKKLCRWWIVTVFQDLSVRRYCIPIRKHPFP